ncbi:MAG: cytochrome c-type biogenesis protein CcmH, partial [Aeromonas veronii]
MRVFIASLLLLLGWVVQAPAMAAIDVYTFDNDNQEQVFRELTKELR